MMKRPVSTQTSLQWLRNRELQKAEANRRLYSPENCQLFTHTWYVLDEILKFENVLSRFNQLIEMWALPGCQQVACDYTDYLDKHQDCNINSLAIGALKGEHKPMVVDDLQAKHDGNNDFNSWVDIFTEFVLRSFNSEQNFADRKYKVSPDQEETRLLNLAIMLRSLMLFKGFNIGNLEKYQYTNLDAAMTTDNDTREHRKLKRIFSRFNMKHSETIKEYARMWIGSRVIYSGPEEYSRAKYKQTGIWEDPRNVDKDIKICDIAVGYFRR